MNLNNPITIQPPTITRSKGEVRVQKPITLNELDYTIQVESRILELLGNDIKTGLENLFVPPNRNI